MKTITSKAAQTRITILENKLAHKRRQLEIESSLEKVRRVALRMKAPDHMLKICETISQQLKKLGVKEIRNVQTAVFYPERNTYRNYEYYAKHDKSIITETSWHNNKIHKSFAEKMQKGKGEFFISQLKGAKLKDWIAYQKTTNVFIDKYLKSTSSLNYYWFSLGPIAFGISTYAPLTKEDQDLFKRLLKVFELAYRRYLDIEKAEAQAREAQIEAALEKVRSRTMAMQQQNDLLGVLDLLVEQLVKLGVNLQVANFSNGIPAGDWDLWIEVAADDGTIFNNYVHFPRIDHAYFHHVEKNIETFRKDGTDLFKDVFSKEEKDSWQDYINTQTIYKDLTSEEIKQFMFEKPGYAWSMVILKDTWVSICRFNTIPFSDEEDALLKRFANAFGQTYTRFLDLQKAEAQAREGLIQLALEKVRSRAMAMQNSEELNGLIGTVFTELTKLDLVLTRCVIEIYDPKTNDARWWMANSETPDEPMNFLVQYHEDPPGMAFLKAWHERAVKWVYTLEGQIKKEWDDFLFTETELSKLPDFVIAGMRAPEKVYLNASFNSFGNLILASLEPLSDEQFDIMLRFAKVFDLSYTRFNDLKQAEAQARQAEKDLIEIKEARKKAEDAFLELKATQKQLIQSEKMASLGELTAGIAHEIQNPLNFVNNFSEVSSELLNEMKAALESGNKEEADEIINDIIQNLEKINHHGKRADAIVKSMLEHSRASSGQKAATDLNALCNEYLRLSYHGMRAKDPSFNAEIKTDFDENVGKINIIPQDIGRVLLNLYNNAIYAVNERQKTVNEQKSENLITYEPTVIVKTSLDAPLEGREASVSITVSDNGGGIPQKEIDKIFQPFFTTKPTGSGTGLGLSLSYDIIKAHGGEIKVESKEGEETTFIIQLPFC